MLVPTHRCRQLLPKGFLLTQTLGSDGHTRNWRTRQLPVVWLVHSTTPGPQHASSCRTGGGASGHRKERGRSQEPGPQLEHVPLNQEGNAPAWSRRTPTFPSESRSFPGPLYLKVRATVRNGAKCQGDNQVGKGALLQVSRLQPGLALPTQVIFIHGTATHTTAACYL